MADNDETFGGRIGYPDIPKKTKPEREKQESSSAMDDKPRQYHTAGNSERGYDHPDPEPSPSPEPSPAPKPKADYKKTEAEEANDEYLRRKYKLNGGE